MITTNESNIYSSKGAKVVLTYGFNHLKLEEIVFFTTANNHHSRRMMEKIGLVHHADDVFNHPNLALDHPLSRHVLYRLLRRQWQEGKEC